MSQPSISSSNSGQRRCIMVCQHSSCQRNGSKSVYEAFQQAQAESDENFFVFQSSCMGQCSSGPTVKVLPDETWYCRIQPSHVAQIVQSHIEQDAPVTSLLHPRLHQQFALDEE